MSLSAGGRGDTPGAWLRFVIEVLQAQDLYGTGRDFEATRRRSMTVEVRLCRGLERNGEQHDGALGGEDAVADVWGHDDEV